MDAQHACNDLLHQYGQLHQISVTHNVTSMINLIGFLLHRIYKWLYNNLRVIMTVVQ